MENACTFFTQSQAELVTAILDRIIPANGSMPGAGRIAVDFIDRTVGGSPVLKRSFAGGLSELEIYAQTAHGQDFINLSLEEQDTVLLRTENSQPEFFDSLVRQTYDGYYSNATVLEALGLEARPPQPRGYQTNQGNLDMLENVRRRGTAYRQV